RAQRAWLSLRPLHVGYTCRLHVRSKKSRSGGTYALAYAARFAQGRRGHVGLHRVLRLRDRIPSVSGAELTVLPQVLDGFIGSPHAVVDGLRANRRRLL